MSINVGDSVRVVGTNFIGVVSSISYYSKSLEAVVFVRFSDCAGAYAYGASELTLVK